MIVGGLYIVTWSIIMLAVGFIIGIFNRSTSDEEHTKPNINEDTINNSFELLSLIDTLINVEISNEFRYETTLKQKYEVHNIDNNVAAIARATFEAFNMDAILNEKNDIIVSQDYILKFIQKRSFLLTVKFLKENHWIE